MPSEEGLDYELLKVQEKILMHDQVFLYGVSPQPSPRALQVALLTASWVT
jgi:hypothetical protein